MTARPKLNNKYQRPSVISLTLGLLLIFGLGSALILSRNNQDVRQQAKTLTNLQTENSVVVIKDRVLDTGLIKTINPMSDSFMDETKKPKINPLLQTGETRTNIYANYYRQSGLHQKIISSPSTAPIVQKVMVIVYDTHLLPCCTSFPYMYTPQYLSELTASSLEEASIEKGYQPQLFPNSSPNVDLVITDTIIHSNQTPKTYDANGYQIADYNKILTDHGVCSKVNQGLVDEVWLWADRTGGYKESIMAGPANQIFNTNGQPIIRTDCNKAIHIMGFNYEIFASGDGSGGVLNPSVANELHSFGHRVENTLALFWDGKDRYTAVPGDTYFEYDGKVGYWGLFDPGAYLGNVEFPPNTLTQYGYHDSQSKLSEYYWWTPQHRYYGTYTSCSDWLCFEELYHLRYLQNIPGKCNSFNLTKANGQPMPSMWYAIYKNLYHYESSACSPASPPQIPSPTPVPTSTPIPLPACPPQLVSPPFYAELTTPPVFFPQFVWSACQGAKSYQVNIRANNFEYTSPTVTNTSLSPEVYLPYGLSYTWRVRSCANPGGQTLCEAPSAYSYEHHFMFNRLISVFKPYSGSIATMPLAIVSDSCVFQSCQAVVVGPGVVFTSPTVAGTTFEVPTSLAFQNGQEYVAKVRGCEVAPGSNTCDMPKSFGPNRYFWWQSAQPCPPQMVRPTDQEVLFSNNFSWKGCGEGAGTYQLSIEGESLSFLSKTIGIRDFQYPANFESNKAYQWKVRRCDNPAGQSECTNPSVWSQARTFYWTYRP